jgi:hypothetical protein
MRFKDREQFINYTQIIPGIFMIIWIVMVLYIAYDAPKYPDEMNGRVYPVRAKSELLI